MKPMRVIAGVMAGLALVACSPKAPAGVDAGELAQAVGQAVGDPGTCVILAQTGSGKVLWRSAKSYVCSRTLPSCVSAKEISVEALAASAANGAVLVTGCSNIGWAAGPTRRDGVVFAAVMQGDKALPGIEIARRLDKAFERAGL